MKLLYSVLESVNELFGTYPQYHNEKLIIIESISHLFFYNNSDLFSITKKKNNDLLILAHTCFASSKEDAIKLAKIIIKNREYLIFTYFPKFNHA